MRECFKAASGGKLGLSLLPTVLSPVLIIGNPKCQKRPSTDSSCYRNFWLDVDDELLSLVRSNTVVVIEQGIEPPDDEFRRRRRVPCHASAILLVEEHWQFQPEVGR